MTVCFVDIETTGLDPDQHEIWEVALITPNGSTSGREHVWQFPIDEMKADPFALEVGGYWERKWSADNGGNVSIPNAIFDAHNSKSRRENFPGEGRAIKPTAEWCRWFQYLTANLHLVGAVPSFDEERLRKLLRANGVIPRWNYHLVDVEALVAGKYKVAPPWNSNELSAAAAIDPASFHRHEALEDARWAKALYEKVMGQW